MAITAVAPPALDADSFILVDWLELTAFFDEKGRARLDEIDNTTEIQKEDHAEDNGTADAEKDERRETIENEINSRVASLGDAYPFVLSEDGEELRLKPRGERRGLGFYLTCLVISHFTKSPILSNPPSGDEAAKVRKRQFQTLATLAVAGHVQGPAVSFGWPRASGETITEAVGRCCEGSGTGTPRVPPGPEAAKKAKDGGMDVIAWRHADNGLPPPAMMYFGQAASGHNWSGKSANDELDQFLGGYFLDRPACSMVGLTVVPFRLSEDDHKLYGKRHGHILDRLRTPKAAMKGIELATVNGVHVDEVDRAHSLLSWLVRYRNEQRAA
ncbi:hypothetical protein [Sphingopyxis granuli]|uniref:hypothetical protein n=1 Tax=Sphingopyxis granuli TaxID=267128 RepID=UPI000ACFFB06|nr:hypothetical protein [Sphingopyxis granuli]